MRSIGIFWKKCESKIQDKNCYTCQYKVDDMSSLALAKESKVDDSFILQINLWNIQVKDFSIGKERPFKAIDFGVVCPLSTSELTFLLPFKVGKSDFHDLVKCLSEDTDLACSVFNEDLKSLSEPDKSYHTIECDKFKYVMYELSEDNIIENIYDEIAETTILTFRINSVFDAEQFNGFQIYIRFRLKLKSFDSLATKKDVSNDWLQSAFSSTYMFDIRINDVRELSKKKKELEEFKGFHLPKFSKIHFFYMSDSEETVENGSSMELDSRLLEKGRWHSYLGKNIEFTTSNIAHHWKKASKKALRLKDVTSKGESANVGWEYYTPLINNFTLFFKTEFSEQKNKRVAFYLFVILALGVIASAIVAIGNFFVSERLWIWLIMTFIITIAVCMAVFRKHVLR